MLNKPRQPSMQNPKWDKETLRYALKQIEQFHASHIYLKWVLPVWRCTLESMEKIFTPQEMEVPWTTYKMNAIMPQSTLSQPHSTSNYKPPPQFNTLPPVHFPPLPHPRTGTNHFIPFTLIGAGPIPPMPPIKKPVSKLTRLFLSLC